LGTGRRLVRRTTTAHPGAVDADVRHKDASAFSQTTGSGAATSTPEAPTARSCTSRLTESSTPAAPPPRSTSLPCCPTTQAEELALGLGRRELGRPPELDGGLISMGQAREEVAAGRVKGVIPEQVELVDDPESFRGSLDLSMTAIARFNATTGVGTIALNWSYRATI
jgi:hypothetical protein